MTVTGKKYAEATVQEIDNAVSKAYKTFLIYRNLA